MKINIFFIFFIILLIQCSKEYSNALVDQKPQPTIKELTNKFHRYKDIGMLNIYDKNNNNISTSFEPTIYTNITESDYHPGKPKKILRILADSKDLDYFINNLNGEYVFYLEKNNKIVMREYGKYYNLSSDRFNDSLKMEKNKINSEKSLFSYLKKNNIKYKIINKQINQREKEIKLFLEMNKSFVYITMTSNYIISNMYYNAKDTIQLNNNLGILLFK